MNWSLSNWRYCSWIHGGRHDSNMQIINGAHEWELKWQVTGEFCNIIERTLMLVRIKLRRIDSGQAEVYLAIWSGIVTNILSPTLRLKFSFDILNCHKCDSNWSICSRGLCIPVRHFGRIVITVLHMPCMTQLCEFWQLVQVLPLSDYACGLLFTVKNSLSDTYRL
jgi:hypothetical protein